MHITGYSNREKHIGTNEKVRLMKQRAPLIKKSQTAEEPDQSQPRLYYSFIMLPLCIQIVLNVGLSYFIIDDGSWLSGMRYRTFTKRFHPQHGNSPRAHWSSSRLVRKFKLLYKPMVEEMGEGKFR